MLKYSLPNLSDEHLSKLKLKQDKIDVKITHGERYRVAAELFSSKSPKATFDEIKKVLKEHAPRQSTCYYCERDRFRDIEHIRPKRHYPQDCFRWENYVYACTICNQDRKNDSYGVITINGELIEFDRFSLGDDAPPEGVDALINIRDEDPLDFMLLDLNTGIICPIGDVVGKLRADFTIRLLGLNGDDLIRHRCDAIQNCVQSLYRLYKYRDHQDVKSKTIEELHALPQPTVFEEIKRQANIVDPKLHKLVENYHSLV